jgi:hypothetical protein
LPRAARLKTAVVALIMTHPLGLVGCPSTRW